MAIWLELTNILLFQMLHYQYMKALLLPGGERLWDGIWSSLWRMRRSLIFLFTVLMRSLLRSRKICCGMAMNTLKASMIFLSGLRAKNTRFSSDICSPDIQAKLLAERVEEAV